jgi:NitT/TauT family transport system permease protein
VNLYLEGSLITHIGITTWETIVGFTVATVLGLAVAIALWWSPLAASIADPYLVILNALPKIALGPILIVWAGAGHNAIISVAVLVTVVVTIITLYSGFSQTDEAKIHLLRAFGANRWQVFTKVVLPSNIPQIVAVVKINIGLAWVGVIVGEFLVSKAGLGYLIVYGGQVFKLDLVMASIFILCVLTAIMYYAVVLFEQMAMRSWHGAD